MEYRPIPYLASGKLQFFGPARPGIVLTDGRTDPEFDPPPESRRCAVCREAASYGFGPPGGFGPAEAWYCGPHREEGERRWAARYRGSSLGPAVLL